MNTVSHQTKGASGRPVILLISPHNSYRIAPYLKAANKLGVQVVVISQGKHSLVEAVASGLHVDFSNPQLACDNITDTLKDLVVTAVIGTDDQTVELAAMLAQFYKLPYNDPESVRLTQRKDLARARLSHSPVNVPQFDKMKLAAFANGSVPAMNYPSVLKPLSLSGSRGVIRVNNEQQASKAAERIQNIVMAEGLPGEESDAVLVEQYIPGYEYAFEGLLQDGKLIRLALFDKPDMMEGPFFEETYYITPSRLQPQEQQQIYDGVQQACQAYGLRTGPVHAEVRLHQGEVWFMELAARTIGGDCARILDVLLDTTLEQLVIELASGRQPKIDITEFGAGVLMIPIKKRGMLRRAEGLLQASKLDYIEDIQISIAEGNELIPLPEGSSYLGFIFARAPDAQLAEKALRDAYAKLNIIAAPVLHSQ